MIVAIHQPNFAPWLGYFAKIAKADVFVYLDHVGYSKNGWTNRVRIKTSSGPAWLTIPALTSGKLGQPISCVRTNESIKWRKKIAGALEANYSRAPYYEAITDELVIPLLARDTTSLSDINTALIGAISDRIGISARYVRSSDLPVAGTKTDLLVSIVRALEGDTYLCGDGAEYQVDEAFTDVGITVRKNNYVHPEYPQAWGTFEPGLSILDALYNIGYDATTDLLLDRQAALV